VTNTGDFFRVNLNDIVLTESINIVRVDFLKLFSALRNSILKVVIDNPKFSYLSVSKWENYKLKCQTTIYSIPCRRLRINKINFFPLSQSTLQRKINMLVEFFIWKICTFIILFIFPAAHFKLRIFLVHEIQLFYRR